MTETNERLLRLSEKKEDKFGTTQSKKQLTINSEYFDYFAFFVDIKSLLSGIKHRKKQMTPRKRMSTR